MELRAIHYSLKGSSAEPALDVYVYVLKGGQSITLMELEYSKEIARVGNQYESTGLSHIIVRFYRLTRGVLVEVFGNAVLKSFQGPTEGRVCRLTYLFGRPVLEVDEKRLMNVFRARGWEVRKVETGRGEIVLVATREGLETQLVAPVGDNKATIVCRQRA